LITAIPRILVKLLNVLADRGDWSVRSGWDGTGWTVTARPRTLLRVTKERARLKMNQQARRSVMNV